MLSTILLAVAAASILFGALLGAARGGKKAGLRLITVLLAAVLAFLLSGPVALGIDRAELAAALSEGVPELAELLAASPSLIPLVIGLLRPILFLLLLFLLPVVFWVVFFILSFFIKKEKKKTTSKGAILGGLQGLLVALMLLAPVLGYISLSDEAIAAYDENADPTSSYDLASFRADYLTPVRENAVLSGVQKLTAPLFTELSTFSLDGEKVALQEELPLLLSSFRELSRLGGKQPSDFGEEEKEALRSLSDHFAASGVLPVISSELLSAMAESFAEGEPFLGIEKPTVRDEFGDIIDSFLTVFSNSDSDTVTTDFDTVTELIILLVDYRLTEVMEGEEDILARLSEKNPETGKSFIKAASDLLNANPHLSPLREGVMSLGAKAVIGQLGTAEEIREECAPMVDDIVVALRGAEGDTNEEKIAAITPSIREELAENGVSAPDDVVDEASRFLLDELEERDIDLSEVTEEDIFAILDSLAAEESAEAP